VAELQLADEQVLVKVEHVEGLLDVVVVVLVFGLCGLPL